MARWIFLSLLGLSFAAGAQQPHPNIVFILVDDQGWNDIGYHNEEIRTPTLDRLAREGVELDAHYVQPQCTPTRVALLTGRYPSRFGPHCMTASNDPAFPIGTPTLASELKRLGYDTALIGKWHLGSSLDHGPNHHGFDHSYGAMTGATGMYDHRYRIGHEFERAWHRNLEYVDEEGHVTDLAAREAVQWIAARGDAPFFLYLPFQAAHTPLVEEDRWLEMNKHIEDPERRLYAAALSHLDDAVRQVMEAIEVAGKRDNTLIVYSSDNGAQVNHSGNQYPPPDPALTDFSSNAPLRGQKTEAHEGGIRVPAFAHWPGQLAPRKVATPMHAVDWLPTLVARAGGAPDREVPWDGHDLWPALQGQPMPERAIYTAWGQARRWEALRLADWKIVRLNKGKSVGAWQLYNLADDPNEQRDLAADQPQRVSELAQRFEAERAKDAPGPDSR
ncbi:MAG: Arylsulfatase [Candidatus Hydrogenedentota bacterium]|jgi:arylsulfatase A-like enzyme